MNIEIIVNEDENFKIQTKQFGKQFIASDGERVCIATNEELAKEEVEKMQEILKSISNNAAPLENPSKGHPFDPFAGTSWEGKRNNFN